MSHQTALITGASGGIGRAIVATLSQMGIAVAMVSRDREKLEGARAELGPSGQSVLTIPCDVTDRAQVKAMVEQVLGQMKMIDIVICGAGMNVRQRSLRALDPADWDQVMATNLTGAFNVLHYVLPGMRARGSGLVVQLSSLSGLRANVVSGAAYSASKFAQSALGACIGREERGRGIRSTVIHAGEVNTGFLDSRSDRPGGGNDSRRQMIVQPQDIADVVRFLIELPPRAHVPELVIKPTIDDFS